MKNNLKKYRMQQGLTQAELARRIKVGRSTISKVESGIDEPSLELSLKLSQVLKVNVNQLFKQKDFQPLAIPINKKSIFSFLLFLFIAGVMFLSFSFYSAGKLIGAQVQVQCQLAQSDYSGDCVDALIAYVDDVNKGNLAKKHAVWALGQLGDEKALPVLKKYYTGEDCKGRDDEILCQYELSKAIKLIESGFNVTAFLWR